MLCKAKIHLKFHSSLSFLYLCKVMSKSKPFFAKLWRSLSEKLKESLTSVLPVSILERTSAHLSYGSASEGTR